MLKVDEAPGRPWLSAPWPLPSARPSGATEGVSRPARLVSLDALRGATIVAMVMVNDQPWVGPYPAQLEHSTWNGWTFADTIFPTFLFLAGASMAFSSLARQLDGGRPTWPLVAKLARRCLARFALGLVVNGFPALLASGGAPGPVLAHLRVMGVLQRIALAWAGASVVLIVVRRAMAQVVVVVLGLLVGYWALMTHVGVPGFGVGWLAPNANLGAVVDRHVLGTAHMYVQGALGYDPEGLLGTLPATATVLLGYWAGRALRGRRSREDWALTGVLVAGGVALVAAGLVWGQSFPINKRLWTSSFVLLMAGWSTLALALCHLVLDRPGRLAQRVSMPLRVLGTNAIVAYLGTELTGDVLGFFHLAAGSGPGTSLAGWLWQQVLAPLAGPGWGAPEPETRIVVNGRISSARQWGAGRSPARGDSPD